MKTFCDTKGREWSLEITVAAIKRVRALCDVNLFEPEAGEPPLIQRLGTDEVLLFDCIAAVLRPQMERLAISDEDFAEGLGGDAATQAAEAFYNELVDFFRKRLREDRVKAVAKVRALVRAGVKAVEERIDAYDPDAMVARELAKLDSKHSLTSSPASSESTPPG